METLFLRDVGLCLSVAAFLAVFASWFGQPLIVAYIAAGALLGPSGFNFIHESSHVELISEIGIILLMFILGQEINISRVIRSRTYVVIPGVAQFILCFAIGWWLFTLLEIPQGNGAFDRLYLSYAFSLSSTMVVIKILSDKFNIDTLVSRITIGILVVQDLWAISFLSLQPSFQNPQVVDLLWSLTKGLLIVGGTFGAAKFVLPPIFQRIGKQPEMILLVAIAWCFAVSGISSELDLSKEMGALLAGVAIATFPFNVDVAAKIASLRDFFVTLFFVGLGLQLPVPNAYILKISAIVSVILILARILTIFPVLHFLKLGIRSSLIPGINLSQFSEFGPVMIALGLQLGHVSQETLSIALMVLIFTVTLSSYTITQAHDISRFLGAIVKALGFKDIESRNKKDIAEEKAFKPKVVLLGFFRDASSLLHELLANESGRFKEKGLVVDYNPVAHSKLKKMGIRCAYGDIGNPEVLSRYDTSETEVVICTVPNGSLRGTSNLKVLRWLTARVPNAKIILTAETFDQAKEYYQNGAHYVYMPRIDGAKSLNKALQTFLTGDGERIRRAQQEDFKNRDEILS